MGRALWMVSVSVNGIPRALWTPEAEALAMRVAHRVLKDVGDQSTDRVQVGAVTQLIRRQCTLAERMRVPEPYLPAHLQCERKP